jgi:DNA polymerase III gamma/tau subunit
MTKEEYLASRTEENLAKRKALGLEWQEKFARLTQMVRALFASFNPDRTRTQPPHTLAIDTPHSPHTPQKKDSEFTDEGLRLTERLLDFNSDCYTIWNFRRLILLSKIREANEEQARLAIEATEQHHNQQHEQQPPHEEERAGEQVEEKKNEETKEEQATTEETTTESGEQAKNENEAKSEEQSEEGQQPETSEEEQTPKAEGEGEEEKKEEEKKELTEEEKKALLDEKLHQIEEAKVKRLCALFERELDAITSPAIKRNPKHVFSARPSCAGTLVIITNVNTHTKRAGPIGRGTIVCGAFSSSSRSCPHPRRPPLRATSPPPRPPRCVFAATRLACSIAANHRMG